MTHSTHHTVWVLGLAFLYALAMTNVVQAQEPVPIATQMTIEPLQPDTYNTQIVYRGSRALLTANASTTLTITPTVSDQASQPLATKMTIAPLQPIEVGRPVIIDAQLGLVSGARSGALNNEVIELYIDGLRERRKRTGPAGKISFRLQRELPPGSYDIQIEYPGSRSLAASKVTARLEIVPSEVTIQTVPPLPGLKFALGERIFASDDQGVARISVDRAGVYSLKVQGIDANDPNIRLEFARWVDEVFAPSRVIKVPRASPLMVGFNVSYRVGQTFVDLAGERVSPDRITSLTLRSSQGTVLTLDDGAPRWLPASTVANRPTGLASTQIQYAVDSVMIDGSNVVNQAQQRFFVDQDDTWEIQLKLYSMSASARDALFGFPIGSGLWLEYPDGRVEVKPFTKEARVSADSLVRGIYRVSVSGAPGLAPISPVALSRDQDVHLFVISYLDLAVVLSLVAILGIGLVVVGRPRLIPDLYHQLAAVRNIRLAHGRLVILRSPAGSRLTPVSGSASDDESPAPARRKLDYTLLLAFAFISVGGLAGGLGALRASAMQATSVPTPDRPTPDVSMPVVQSPPRQAAAPGDAPAAPISTKPTPVPAKSPAPIPAAQPGNSSSAEPQSDISVLKFQRVLRKGSRGSDVASLQQRLRELGYFTYPTNTGYFGPRTQRAVTTFQVDHCVPETGVVDAEVINVLNRTGTGCAKANNNPEGTLR